MKTQARAGFIYTLEWSRNGKIIDTEHVKNLLPIEGLNYLIAAGLTGGTTYGTWYMGLFRGSYMPVPGDTMSAFPAAATEMTDYALPTRPAITFGAVANGAVDNQDARSEFAGTVNGRIVQGGFIASAPAKGGTTGILISAVRFPSPKTLGVGDILRVTGGFSMISN